MKILKLSSIILAWSIGYYYIMKQLQNTMKLVTELVNN